MDSFKRNDILAVHGTNNQFWLCKSLQNINRSLKNPHFKALWLEKGGNSLYSLQSSPHYVPRNSILRRVYLKKTPDQDFYQLPPKVKLRLQRELGVCDDEESDDDNNEDAMDTDEPKSKSKKSSSRKRKAPKAAKKEKNAKQKKKKIETKVKPKVDKTNPNWRLKPRPSVVVMDKDPLFEDYEEMPFISTSVQSQLITRAIHLNDLKLLEKSLNDRKTICEVNPRRSLALSETPLDVAFAKGNVKGKIPLNPYFLYKLMSQGKSKHLKIFLKVQI